MAYKQQIFIVIALASTWILGRSNNLIKNSWWLTFFSIETSLFVTGLLYKIFIYPNFVSPLRNLPTPKADSWINGHFPRMRAEPTGFPHREWIHTVPNNGLIRYMSILNTERVMITTPEAHREVLSQKSYEYVKPRMMMGPLIRLLGRGVLVVEGDEHRVQRKNLMPAFSFRHIKDLYPVFWDKTRDLISELDKTVSKSRQPVNIAQWASRVTLDIIGIACIGSSFNAIEDPNGKLASVYRDIFTIGPPNIALAVIGQLIPIPWLMKLPTKRNIKVNAASKFLREYCGELVADKRKKLADGKQQGVDILSVAIESGGFTDESLVNQMMTFLAAGHETTSTALTWCISFMCKHPTIQTRLREELRQHAFPNVRDRGPRMTPDILDKVPYLAAVCSESLRWMPPVPMTMRMSSEDNVVCGQLIPAGTMLVLSPQAINFDKAMWGPDADEFNPDRWMRDGCANTGGAESNYAFLSFLHGPRSCIGQSFAKAEFASLLAGLVSAYEIQLADPNKKIEITGGVTQRVKGGLDVILTPVEA